MTPRHRPAPPPSYTRPGAFDGHRFPPLLAVGPDVDPYPDPLVSAWLNERHPRLQTAVEPVALGLRGITGPMATRDATGWWTVELGAIQQLQARIIARGYLEATITAYGGGRDTGLADRLDAHVFRDAIAGHLNDASWYAPHALPPLTSAVASALTAVLAEQFPVRGRAEPLTEREYDRRGGLRDELLLPHFAADDLSQLVDPDAPYASRREWGDSGRRRQAWIDQSIAATGRTTPYRLRPIVVVTRNAGAREHAYRGWAMYEAAERAGVVELGPMVAIWAYCRSGFPEWVRIGDDSSPTVSWWSEEAVARLNRARWHGFDHTWWARVHCAVSGTMLYPTNRGRLQTDPPDSDTLVPPVPTHTDVRDWDLAL